MAAFTTRPEIRGTFGVVASTHWLASTVGMSVLERGGNAFDAAAAMGFVLQVAEPHMNGLGGEVPILFWSARENAAQVLCGQGPAPAAATIDRFRDLGLDLVPGTGLLPAVVPGAFGAWLTLLRDHGTWELTDILAPAIAYAQDGVPLLPQAVDAIESVREMFARAWPTSAAVFTPGGEPPTVDQLFANPTIAHVWRRIIEESAGAKSRERRIDAAIDAFYRGFVAETIGAFYGADALLDSSGERHVGLLCADDLAGWAPSYEAPVSFDYHGNVVLKCGPWSQGPVFVQQLALLAGFDIASMDPSGADFVHTVIECAKLAFADREAYYGDPDFVDVPLDTLLSADYNAARRELVGETASRELRPGAVDGHTGRIKTVDKVRFAGVSAHGAREPRLTRYENLPAGLTAGDTCHLDIVDRFGNMVAATPSGGWLQASPVVAGLGFPITTRGQMFWLEPGYPASLAPGKRPRTTLTPTMVLRDGSPYLAFGTPGGDQQDQWTVPFLLRHLHHGLNLQQACEAPLFHTIHFPGSFYPRTAEPGAMEIDGRFDEATINSLKDRDHDVTVTEPWSLGRVTVAARDGALLRAAATPCGLQCYAIGR